MDSEESPTPDPSTTPSTPTTQDVPGVPEQGLERSTLVTGSRVQIVSGALVATCIIFLSSLSGEEPLGLQRGTDHPSSWRQNGPNQKHLDMTPHGARKQRRKAPQTGENVSG